MEKKGIVIAANMGLDPALAMALVTTNIRRVQGISEDNLLSKYSNEAAHGLDHYFIQQDCVAESLKLVIDNQELLILIGYPETPQLINLANELMNKMTVMIIGHYCSTFLISQLIDYQVDVDYLQAAASWCLKKKIKLSEKVVKACTGDENIAKGIIERYERAWSIVYNLDIRDYAEHAKFHAKFTDEIIHGKDSRYIKKKLRLYDLMNKETHRLAHHVQDLGFGIGFIKASSKPFFKANALTAIKGGYLVKIIEYMRNNQTEHIVFYDSKTKVFDTKDVTINDGPFQIGVIGEN
ncbi:MAG: hypothetical protein WAW11_04650 [Patescibacteria group bacterium]